MAEPAQLPAASQEAARIKLKQREDAIRANAIKDGRKKERDEILATLGAKTLDELTMLGQVKSELAAQHDMITRHAVRHARWFGGAIGAAVASIAVCAAFTFIILKMQADTMDQAQRIAAQATLVGAATQRQAEQ